MTDETKQDEKQEEQVAEDEPTLGDEEEVAEDETGKEQDQEEAKAAFRSGFEKVRPPADGGSDAGEVNGKGGDGADAEDGTGSGTDAEDAKRRADEQARAAAEQKAAKEREDFIAELPATVRKLQGQIGGLTSKLQEAVKAAKAAPGAGDKLADADIKAAIASPEAMQKLLEDFPEFQPVADELAAIRKVTESISKGDEKVDAAALRSEIAADTEARIAEAVEMTKLDLQRPGWKDTIQQPTFLDFAVDGGPSKEEYQQFLGLDESSQEAKDMMFRWATEHTTWWVEKGKKMCSPRAEDAVALVTQFDEHQKTAGKKVDPAERRRKNQQRLARAAQPVGTSGMPPARKSDHDAFRAGFEKIRGAQR